MEVVRIGKSRRICFIFFFFAALLPALFARAEAVSPLPVPVIVSSDAFFYDTEDYYASHPEEDPLLQDDAPQLVPSPEDASEGMALASADCSYVRIRLSTTGNILNVTLNGVYSLMDANGAVCALPDSGSVYSFAAVGNTVFVYFNGAPLGSGAQFTLREHAPGNNALTLYNSVNGVRSYKGNLIVYAENGVLVFVNHIYIEDYLCGVVGNEIGDSSRMEALKAQAVAARSYAVSCISPSKRYDMLDTSANQTYKGICSDHPNSAIAVYATAKQLIMKNGALVPGFYSSSNGGEKDTSRNRWGGPLSWAGEAVAADDADYRYGINYAAQNNNNNRYHEQVVFPANGQKTTATCSLIRNSLLPRLKALDARFASATENDITLSGLSMQYTPYSQADPVSYLSYLHVRYMGTVYGEAFDVTDSIYYTSFYVAQGWGFFSNGDLNRYWIGFDPTNNAYVLRHARRGHGVGLSQAGARRMGLDGRDYSAIITFYYDGAVPVQSALIGDKLLTSRTFVLPKGDVNDDYIVSVHDVIKICRYLAGLDTLSATQLNNADVNLDGSVTLADAITICRFIAGLL